MTSPKDCPQGNKCEKEGLTGPNPCEKGEY